MANDDFFDRDNLFGDDDDFNGDDFDDSSAAGDDFDEFDLGLDDDDTGVSFEDDDDFGGSGRPTGEGPSRTFVIIAVVLIVLLLLGFGLIVLIVLGGGRLSEGDMTRTAVKLTNDAVEILAAQTQTQSAFNLFETATADAYTDTPSPTSTNTEVPTATEDTSALQTQQFLQTIEAADQLATATALQATENFLGTLNPPVIVSATATVTIEGTAVAGGGPTATMPVGGTPVEIGAVQMTATALAGLFGATPTVDETAIPGIGGGEVTPTREGVGTPVAGGQLPQTGLFDDVFGSDPGTIFLAAFGLLSVIVLSRRIRSVNRKRQ